MWTASPPRSSPRTSTSPVWTPARSWTPSDCRRPRSPDGAPHRPRRAVERSEEAVAGRVDLAAAEALELRAHERRDADRAGRASAGRPARAALSSTPTMSVNSSVVSTRSGSLPVRAPVRNSSISSAIRSMPCEYSRWSSPGSSTSSRSGITAATSSLLCNRDDPIAHPVQDERRARERREESCTSDSIVCR